MATTMSGTSFSNSTSFRASQSHPPSYSYTDNPLTQLPSVDFNFEDLRQRMAAFTVKFDAFIEKGRKRVLEERNEFRGRLGELGEEQRSTTTQIGTLQSTLSTHSQILSRESSEKIEMLSQITSLESHQSAQAAQRDKLKNAIVHTQRQIDAKLAAQREYAAKVDGQSRMNGPELNFWETYLGCRFEGCRFEGRGDEDGIRVIFSFEPAKQGPTKGQEREAMFEMKLPSGPGGKYDVVYTKPKLEMTKVQKVVEKMNESREIATLLKGMRGLFVEEMQGEEPTTRPPLDEPVKDGFDCEGGVPPISTSEAKSRKKKAKKRKGGNTNVPAGDAAPATAEDAAEETSSPTKVDAGDSDDSEPEESDARRVGTSTETSVDDEAVAALTNGMNNADLSDTAARFDVLVKDRDALRTEVTQLRQALEALQSKHDKDLESVKEQLQDTQNEKDEAQEQYQNLLGKVNTIRSQLGERLKADAEDLAQARTRIEELEEQKSGLQEQYTAKSAEVEELTSENQAQSKELSSLRNRANLSQQNWIKERNELVEQEAYMREEFENTKQAMHDWEVLAMEERTVRKDLADRASDLEEQLASLKQAYDKADSDRTTQSNAVEGLQKALQEIQTARKIELRELVESSQAESESLKKQLHEAQVTATTATTELEITRKELERASPFEKEVKEKNLLIGKLRHEAVILNDHLTKALRFLKKGKPEDNVDRQIVTSYLIQFLALDRADPKKFQILQLIAALLGWTDEQKERAGLQRTGAPSMTGSLRLPGSPLVHRTPSSPALGSDYFPDSVTSPDRKESLADLWQNFLEQEASQSTTSRGGKSRTASTSTVSTPKP